MNTIYSRKTVTLIIWGLIALVILLSLGIFSQQSLRLDEAQSLWQTSHTPSKILNIIAQDVHVPFYHFILHFWQLFLGSSVFAARMLSLLFFVLSIPAIYFLGRRAFNSSVAIFATILFAVSPFMNWYGNEIRMYTLFTLLTILSHYFFLGIYCKQGNDNWLGYFLTALFGIFTHYFFFFIILVQAIFYLMYRSEFPAKSFKRFMFILFILLTAIAPWLIYVRSLNQISNVTPLLAPPTSVNVFNAFSQFLFGFQNDHLNTILVSLWPITVLLGFLALRKNRRVSPEIVYILMSILIPIALAFIVSISIVPLFVSRYLILTIPSMYIFIGWIFSTYPDALRKSLKAILIVAMLAGIVVEAVSPSTPVKENYRAASEFLETYAGPQDVIILAAPFTVYPVDYYYRGPTEIVTLPQWNRFIVGPIPPFSEEKLPEEVNQIKGSHEKAYVLLSYDQGFNEAIRLYFDRNYERLETKNFSLGLDVYVYRLRYDERVLGQ